MPVTLSIERTAARARWFDARASVRIDRRPEEPVRIWPPLGGQP